MRQLMLILLFTGLLRAQPALSFVANSTGGVDLKLTGGSVAAGIQLLFAVPPDAKITAGPAVTAPKSLSSRISAGVANLIVVGGQAALADGVLAQVAFSPAPWAFSAVQPLAVDAAGQ